MIRSPDSGQSLYLFLDFVFSKNFLRLAESSLVAITVCSVYLDYLHSFCIQYSKQAESPFRFTKTEKKNLKPLYFFY